MSLAKQMGLLFLGRGIAFGFTFFIPVVLVRIFSVEEFGLYKQIFLIAATLVSFLRFGMEPSLFYFIPRNVERKNIYISQTIIFYIFIGSVVFLFSFISGGWVASLVNNSEISGLFPLISLYAALMLISLPMEGIMISLEEAKHASLAIISVEIFKAFVVISAAYYIQSVEAVIYAMILVVMGRLFVMRFYLYKGLNFSFERIRKKQFIPQLTYAIPLALSGFFRQFSDSVHFFIVSSLYSVSSFAIYSVGLLQLPIVTIFFSSILEPSMVRIAKLKKNNDIHLVPPIISDAVKKMAIIFFPIYCFLTVNAREFILTLYTDKFQESIPIFLVSILILPLSVINFNYVLRSFGETKFLSAILMMRLVLTVCFVLLGLRLIGLLGGAIGVIVSLLMTYLMFLLKIKKLMNVKVADLLPIKELTWIVSCTVISTVLVLGFKMILDFGSLWMLINSFIIFSFTYLIFIYRSKVVSEELEIAFAMSRKFFRMAVG